MTDAVQLFFEGDDLYEDMLASIAGARRRVLLETYILAEDHVGRSFARALKAAARRGVHVRLHVDAVGCLFEASDAYFRDLRLNGVKVRVFHRWSWRDPWRYNRRNHCKLLIIDDNSLFIGGFNLHDQSSRRVVGETRWRDTHLRLHDPRIITQGVGLFDAFWRRRKRDARLHRPAPDTPLALVTNRIRRQKTAFRAMFRNAFIEAQREIRLITPYFAPDALTRHLMVKAARRGIRVRLLLPAVSDQHVVQMAARHLYGRLLDAGVEIHEYQPRVLHAKTITVDGSWATVGTANMDYRSFFHNYELNLVIRDPETCRELDEQFERDIASAVPITADAVKQRGLVERWLGRLAWSFRRWL